MKGAILRMYDKETTFSIIDVDIMNKPFLWKEANVAVLPEKYDPESFYVRVRSISAGEYFGSNRNADYFQEAELIKAYPTFLDAHVFKNHENKDVANAIGSIISSVWNDAMKCIELILRIDRELAPTIVRGFEKGYTTDVSMGCRVSYTVCSICGNKAKTRAEFCDHVKTMRNKVNPDGSKVFEYNYGPRFHDLSVVLNGADRTAKVLQIYDKQNLPFLSKAASFTGDSFPSFEECIIKEAGAVCSPNSTAALVLNDSGLKGILSLPKLASFKKEVTDKLYVISLINRMEENGTLTDDDIATILQLGKEASLPLHLGLEKHAGRGVFGKDLRNLAIGATGIAGATNYFQGKRLRGEYTSGMENFVADNPGVLPVLFMLAGYPAYKKMKGVVGKYNPLKKTSFTYSDLFTKEAEEYLNVPLTATAGLLDKPELASLLEDKYNLSPDKQSMAKLALCLYQAGREDLVDDIKVNYAVTDSDLTDLVVAGINAARDELEKEASLAYGVLVSNLFNTQKIPTGLSAPLLAGSVVDGYLISKLLGDGVSKKPIGASLKQIETPIKQ